MSIRNLISKFLTQLCEKNYSQANETLKKVVDEKTKEKVAKVVAKKKGAKKVTKKGKK